LKGKFSFDPSIKFCMKYQYERLNFVFVFLVLTMKDGILLLTSHDDVLFYVLVFAILLIYIPLVGFFFHIKIYITHQLIILN